MKIIGYYRVSTEEQKKYGLSVEAQIAEVHAWAQKNGHTIIGEYNDAGISARKPISKRKSMQLLLKDLEYTHADLIVFTRLDRWFRSVREYYKVQDVLDNYKVAWKALEEDYETVTATGRFKVNIMLSVAENEADKTSERIKSVVNYKVLKGEIITGSIPLGYKAVGKKLVPDENADVVRDLFNYYEQTGSKYSVMKYLSDKYGITRSYRNVGLILSRELYTGVYRENQDYCEPIISKEQFQRVQSLLSKRSVRTNQSGRVYLFTGLITCASCGRIMTSAYSGEKGRSYYYYRCPNALIKHTCVNHKIVVEKDMEEWLLTNLPIEFAKYKSHYEKPQKKKTVNEEAIKKKLARLKTLYVDGHISLEEYKADYQKYSDMLPIAPPTQRIRTGSKEVDKILSSDFRALYGELNRQERAIFWRSVVSRIVVNENGEKTVYFN